MWVILIEFGRLEGRQHGGEDLEPQVLLVAEAVRAPLEDLDLVVQALDKAEGHLVRGLTVRCDLLPMALDHRGKAFEWREALRSERRGQLSRKRRTQPSWW